MAIRSVSEHVKQRMAARSVLVDSIQDAVENPPEIGPVKYDKAGRPSFSVTGLKATLAVNPDTGVIVTCYPTHSRTREKLLEELKEKENCKFPKNHVYCKRTFGRILRTRIEKLR